MERKVNIVTNQKVTAEDFNNFGAFPRESVDHVVKDLGGFPSPRYTGLLVEPTGQSTVRVGAGRFHKGDGSVYGFDQEVGQTIDLLDFLPAVAKRVATIVSYGSTVDTVLQPRTKLINADTRETQGFEHATESRRQAYVGFVMGQESPTPSVPAIQSDYVAVAHVILTPAGIESITQVTGNRLGSIRENAEAIALIDRRLASVGPQIDTLKTDISGLGAMLRNKADRSFVSELALDVARVKDLVELPDDYATYGADFFLSEDESDTAHADYAARVNEGVRFPTAGSAITHIALENPLEPRVIVNANLALPKYATAIRTSIVGNNSEYPLTNTTVENVQLKTVVTSRTVRKMMGSERICTNSRNWLSGRYDPISGIFTRNGETFTVDIPINVRAGGSYNGLTHGWVTLNKYVEHTIVEHHVSQEIVAEAVAGSVTAQTVLNSQDGWMAGVNLFFTKKASSGNVRVLVCDTDQSDNPMLDRVLGEATIAVADLKVWPEKTAVAFNPFFIPKGRRYAIVLISSNAHFIAQVAGNKFAQGTIKYLVDGSWSSGDATIDIAFETVFAAFEAAVTTVQLQALELAGGIDSLEINTDAVLPDGTALEFEVRVGGVWRNIKDAVTTNILSSRPSIVQFRAHFIGTTDVQPAMGLGATRSQVTLVRPAATGLVHISTARMMPVPVAQIEVRLRLENWDNAEHVCNVSLLVGAGYTTVETADVTTSEPARDDPNGARIKRFIFNVTAIESFKIKIVGNIGASALYYHVAERGDLEFTS